MAEPGTRRLTFSLPQLETDSESRQIERANRIRQIVKTREAGKIVRNSVDVWCKPAVGNDAPTLRTGFTETDSGAHTISNTEEESKRNCCDFVLRFLGGKDVAKARFSLMLIIFDWVVDFSLGIFHISNENWLAGGMTLAIVFGAGCIITFANFSPHDLDVLEIHAEVKKMSRFYWILMYIPSFYPICTTKLLLYFTQKLVSERNEENKLEITRKRQIVEEKALWDQCCESTFEAFPQAVLQIVLIFDRYKAATSALRFLDFLPLLSILLSTYGITQAPITVIQSRSSDFTLKFGEKLVASSTLALRVLCWAFFIISCKTLLLEHEPNSLLWNTVLAIGAALLSFAVYDVPYIVRHELENRKSKETDVPTINGIIDVIFVLATFCSFQFWVVSWFEFAPLHKIQFSITMALSIFLMILAYYGLYYYRFISVHYRNIAASVIVYAYDATKRWILSWFGVKLKRDRSIGPVNV